MSNPEERKSFLVKAIGAWIVPVMVGMGFSLLAISLYDRFSGNGKATSFYYDAIDATCMVYRERGKDLMVCFDGDRFGGDE